MPDFQINKCLEPYPAHIVYGIDKHTGRTKMHYLHNTREFYTTYIEISDNTHTCTLFSLREPFY